MQTSSASTKNILRSPTPPLDSSSDELNDLSLDQELAHLDEIEGTGEKRPHFLDYQSIPPPDFDERLTQIGIPYPIEDNTTKRWHGAPPFNQPGNAPLTSLPPTHLIPNKMIRSADNVPTNSDGASTSSGKKHFLDENPIPPDYMYEPHRQHRSLDREYDRKDRKDTSALKLQFDSRRHSAERSSRQKKIKEPSYTLSRFLENDDASGQYFDSDAVHLNDVNLSTNNSMDRYGSNSKVECVYSLLSMIGCNNPFEMSKKFLELSRSPVTCATLRHSRCIPLLVQMIHFESDDVTKQQAREALKNVVNYHPDDKAGRRESKVLRYIEQIMDYCEVLRKSQENGNEAAVESDSNPLQANSKSNFAVTTQAMRSLMQISFDEEHRHAMCQLGGLQTIASLVHYDHAVHGMNPKDPKCISLRRYAGMILTNLTFGDGNNKALLCANKDFMKALVAQISTDADDLLQVTANVLRNLSWRADNNMKAVLNEIGTVTALTVAAMKNKNENTLRAILSALWNLSAHCSKNKAEFCLVDGALLFLVEMLTYDAPSKTLSIIENAGGILRNVSSHIAVNEDFRKTLRQRNCLGILLQQLKSESLTIVSNACGTLWNLSARCPEDQKFLWDNGAVPMLRSLIHSKHKMISNGSKVALKNLVNFRPGEVNRTSMDPVAKMMGLKELPTLSVRKQRALEDELDENLSETCENIETKTPPPLAHAIQHAPNSLSAIEIDQKVVERNFGQLSLQCNANNTREPAESTAAVPKLMYDSARANKCIETGTPSRTTNSTGTIPKRIVKTQTDSENERISATSKVSSQATKAASDNEENEEEAAKAVEIDSDQITNFSLLYSENHPELRDSKAQKERTFSVAEEDTIKCYDNEGTPMLSTATSISDLRPMVRQPLHNMHRNMKSGRTTTENSGINTPEKPIFYCEEGTPAYFSRRDSFNSLNEEDELIKDMEYAQKPQTLNILPHKNEMQQPSAEKHANVESARQESGNDSSSTVPTTPGECTGKTVTFNAFNLETPMMFSRHSSLGSLASHEPALNDDIGSVVSDISRMPSGIISPSEIPDSPSQTMPQSPRQKVTHDMPSPNARTDTVDDEVRTFEQVENTPALISCATSLSNLSLDDEPKIANDSLIKEMRLMHHASDEQQDENDTIELDRDSALQIDDSLNDSHTNANEADDILSDTDESVNNSLLLANCMGIQGGALSTKHIETDIKSPPALPEPNQILHDDSLSSEDDDVVDNGDHEDLLQQCIQTGISKSTARSIINEQNQSAGIVKLPLQQLIKENPIGMLRKGGNSYIETDEMNRFHIEDSPCNFSIASGLSDLTVGSHSVGLLKTNRLPSIQSDEKHEINENENRSLSPISVDSEEGNLLLNQAISVGQSRLASSIAQNINASAAKKEEKMQHVEEPQYIESNSSISSIDSNDSANCDVLLQQCINLGISKPVAAIVQQNANSLPSKTSANQQMKRSQLPMLFKPSAASKHRSRATKRDRDDEQLLLDCINTGIERLNAATTENTPPNVPLLKQPINYNSKNAQTTSATSVRPLTTVGATDVVAVQKGTSVCVQDQHRPVDTSQTMTPKIVREANIKQPVDGINVSATVSAMPQTPIEIGFNNASTLNTSMLSTKSHNSFNMNSDIALLERSNEYPACLSQTECIMDSLHSSSVDMEISNECLFEALSPQKIDKHKDPDLMIQSMERLTHEFVSTAEYLRTANSNEDDTTITTENKLLSDPSNNTWNEDTHPNGISFPSISKTAPIIASMQDDDATISDSNVASRYELAHSKILDESTPTNEFSDHGAIDFNRNQTPSNGLQFKIGGKINQLNFADGNYGFSSHDTNSTMTNSTIIAIEANKIRKQIMNDFDKTDSIISLDKIRPPSVMEKMNSSSYCDSLYAPSSLKNSPGKFLMQGFMARRAIQNNNSAHGSMDSINSSCNLDRVKPPSIMDELLDSMISVDSIASEIIDNPEQHQPVEELSRYETAFSECDDMTTTLKCCPDLPMDEADQNTPSGSDFSSVESTPKKGRRSLTPRRKRQLTKDRYQTYTIATGAENGVDYQSNENGANYFQMDISTHTLLLNDNDSDAISLVSTDDGDMSSIRAITKNLPYLNDNSINTNTYTKHHRFVTALDSQTTPTPSEGFYESLPIDSNGSGSSKTQSPNHTYTKSPSKSPRIIKPNANTPTSSVEQQENGSNDAEQKAVRGRKKPAYVSPYSMTKLVKTSPIKAATASPTTSKVVTPTKMSAAKTAETKAKSIIQRGAESLVKKIRPSFTSKLTKQTVAKKSPNASNEKISLSRQHSNQSTQSSETLIRQSTFIKDEPSSEGEIPVIVSEPTSPKKTKPLISKIPFNRTTSLQATRNVTKCKTNIEIPSQKIASNTFTRRNLKNASSTSQIATTSTGKTSLSPRASIETTASGKSGIFRKWSQPTKANTSTQQSNTTKVAATKASMIATSAKKPLNTTGIKSATASTTAQASSLMKPSKIATSRAITTNGRTTKV